MYSQKGNSSQRLTQSRNCNFPKRKFSNGNLSFNPAWYDISEAKGWLEYSKNADRMYCFACRLFKMSLWDAMIGREINHYWPGQNVLFCLSPV